MRQGARGPSTELLAPWRGCVIKQPSLFIADTRDGMMHFPGMADNVKRLAEVLPGLRGTHLIEGAGHWIQRERAVEVNSLLLGFLSAL